MANVEHLEILKQGVEVWNRWREENPEIRPDLSEVDLRRKDLTKMYLFEMNLMKADFSGANLDKVDLYRVDLSLANLTKANLTRANLTEAHLSLSNFTEANLAEAFLTNVIFDGTILHGANLVEANLSQANFVSADLEGADLSGAKLSLANFIGAYLDDVCLSNTIFEYNTLADVDLRKVQGLETVKHYGPSTIGFDTIYKSKGQIPEVFLRGVGLPDTLITYITSLTSEAIQYYSCFISYSNQDDAFAQRLHADLQQKGVRCWFAPEDMKIGDKIRPTIDQSIRVHDTLLLVLSKNSIASQWVEQEVETALERERQQQEKVLFPVRLDESVMEIESGWPALIRNTRHIGDFSRWKDHNAYQQAFGRLLRDLKAEG